jgi:hypothetical protein
MNIDDKENYLIDQFCIFHYDDFEKNIFRSYITYERKAEVDGKTISCYPLPSNLGKWKLYGKFYAISSLFRPIPHGLKLLNTEVENKRDGILDLEHMYDPFNTSNVDVNFITWTTKVSETVPLYLHITPDNFTYVSFDQNPPVADTEGWGNNELSPIYVLVDNSYYQSYKNSPYKIHDFPKDKNGVPKFKFSDPDDRCVPTSNKNGMSLERCFLKADENIYDDPSEDSISLIQRLNYIIDKGNKSKIAETYSKIPFVVVCLVVLIFFIVTVFLVIKIFK